jgi:hypothetical protein
MNVLFARRSLLNANLRRLRRHRDTAQQLVRGLLPCFHSSELLVKVRVYQPRNVSRWDCVLGVCTIAVMKPGPATAVR